MNNFNDHKKPKKFKSDEKHIIAFMEDIYRAIAGKLIFQALREESYGKGFRIDEIATNPKSRQLLQLVIKSFE
jgi:hypothetical protein